MRRLQRQLVGAEPADRTGDGDVTRLDPRIGRTHCGHDDIGAVQRRGQGGNAQRRRGAVRRERGGPADIVVRGRDGQIGRVQQQRAGLALRRGQIDRAVESERQLARHLGKTAVATLSPTLGADMALVAREIVGPDDDLATVAVFGRIGANHRIFRHISGPGIAHIRILALGVAADQHAAAAAGAGRIDQRAVEQTDTLAGQADFAALAGAAGGADLAAAENGDSLRCLIRRAGSTRFAGQIAGRDRDAAARRSAGCVQHHIAERDIAVGGEFNRAATAALRAHIDASGQTQLCVDFQLNAAALFDAGSINLPCRALHELTSRNLDLSGRAGLIGAGADRAGIFDAVAGFQTDHAALVDQAGSFQAAAVADDPALQAVGCLRGQNDQTAGRFDGIAVIDQRLNGGGFDPDVAQTAAVELQFEHFAGSERNRAHLSDDHAMVADFGRQQGDITVQIGTEFAFVDDRASRAFAAETQFARHEIGVADAVRGGGERADVGARGRAEVNAARIGQEDLAVGRDVAEDLARVGVEHAIEDGAAGGRLQEIDPRLTADIEGLPVDCGPVAGLIDVHDRVILADRGLAGDHLASGGQLRRCRRGSMPQPDAEQRQGQRAQAE